MIRCAWLAAMLVTMGGCGGNAKGPERPEKEQAPDRETRGFATGKVEIAQRREDRSLEWTVRAEKSSLQVAPDGTLSGALEGVAGELFKGGEVASNFVAQSGEADQVSNRLILRGRVAVLVQDPKSTLRADRVTWLGQSGLIEAQGNVEVETDTYRLGPFERVLATPDLREVGTPDQFANRPVPPKSDRKP